MCSKIVVDGNDKLEESEKNDNVLKFYDETCDRHE